LRSRLSVSAIRTGSEAALPLIAAFKLSDANSLYSPAAAGFIAARYRNLAA
jgi:hypothetical protein